MNQISDLIAAMSNPVLALCAVYIAKQLAELNTKMAVIVERVDSHEKRLTKIEDGT